MTTSVAEGEGYDPFPGETPFDDATLDALHDYIQSLTPFFRLRDWDLRVSRGIPTGSDSLGETFIRDWGPEAVFSFSGKLATYPEIERRKTIVHELLHPATHAISKYARDMMKGEVGQETERFFVGGILTIEEEAIDRLARGLAQLFPASPSLIRK